MTPKKSFTELVQEHNRCRIMDDFTKQSGNITIEWKGIELYIDEIELETEIIEANEPDPLIESPKMEKPKIVKIVAYYYDNLDSSIEVTFSEKQLHELELEMMDSHFWIDR